MLAGAYSKTFQAIERDHVENIKAIAHLHKDDSIARARRLTQETNKRRKAQALKRKHEVQKEEKRRQEILSKRREEQRKATEKYQRSHIPPGSQSSSRKSSPTHSGIEEALKLIRGTPPLSRQSSLSSSGSYRRRSSPRSYDTYNHDPLNRAYFNKYSSRHMRPQSPGRQQEQAREHREMLDKSLRNLTNSRSLFEQQLQQHQQLLIEDQKKSLHQFNEAIMKEIEDDKKVQGMEEIESDLVRSDSLSSIDSLEASEDSLEIRDNQNSDQSNAVVVSNCSGTNLFPSSVHYSTPVGRVIPSIISSNTTDEPLDKNSHKIDYFPNRNVTVDSVNSGRNDEKFSDHSVSSLNGAGGGYRLVDQPVCLQNEAGYYHTLAGQPVSVPSDPPIASVHGQVTRMFSDPSIATNPHYATILSSNTIATTIPQVVSATSQVDRYDDTTRDQKRSAIQTKAWATPSPQTYYNPSQGHIQAHQAAHFSETKVNPYSTRNTTTSVTTTSACSALPAPVQQKPISTQGGDGLPARTTVSSIGPDVPSKQAAPVLASNTQSVGHAMKGKVATVNKPQSNSAGKGLQHGHISAANLDNEKIGGSILDGTLGLVNGRLTFVHSESDTDVIQPNKDVTKETMSDVEVRELKGILKRQDFSNLRKANSTGSLQQGLSVKDSLEVAKGHLKHAGSNEEQKERSSSKKSVRFADIHYEEDIPEDTDSVDSNTDAAVVKKIENNRRSLGSSKGTPKSNKRVRPMSAKVTSSARSDGVNKAPRAASAGITRSQAPGAPQHAQNRPKAAAHIITHSTEGAQFLNSQVNQGNTSYSSSQPEKKITVISNNFMGKAAVTSKSVSAPSQGVIYTMSNAYADFNGNVSTAPAEVADNNKSVSMPTSSDSPPGVASTQQNQPVYNENGLRIDRTPTDDEINWLWDKVRTCLHRSPGSGEKKPPVSLGATDSNTSRQTAHVSNKYIDGTSLGLTSAPRVTTGFGNNHGVQHRAMSTLSSGRQKGSTGSNGYLRKYGLLQQRRQQANTIGRGNPVHHVPAQSNNEPQAGTVYQPKEDVTESMAGFLVAEQLANQPVSDNQIQSAMQEAQTKQHNFNVARTVSGKGNAGPSALSVEEQKLLESLDRLNEKLKITESQYPSNTRPQQVQQHQSPQYMHLSDRRGHHPV